MILYFSNNARLFDKSIILSANTAKDPLAWPTFATAEDLAGMPRTVIRCAEND